MSDYNVTFKGYEPLSVSVVYNNGLEVIHSPQDAVPDAERNHLEIHFSPNVDKFKVINIAEDDDALTEITISTPSGEIFIHLNYNIVAKCSYENYMNEGYRWILVLAQLNETDIQLRKIAGKAVNDADVLTLDEYRVFKVDESKKLLAIWLASHPILYTDGKTYSVTEEKQSLLNNNIASYERATAAGVQYPLKWNATGEECVPWDYGELLKLSLAIAGYVAERVAVQQAYEIAVFGCDDKTAIDNIVLDYDLTATSEEEVVETEEPTDTE